jgi:hypothetical protein
MKLTWLARSFAYVEQIFHVQYKKGDSWVRVEVIGDSSREQLPKNTSARCGDWDRVGDPMNHEREIQ